MTFFAQTNGPGRGARSGSRVGWLLAVCLVPACSLLVPNDDYYLGGPSGTLGRGRAAGGDGGVGGQAGDDPSGQAGSDAGAGGQHTPSLGGSAGQADAGAPSGGEPATICDAGRADCNHRASDGCEIDLSSSAANCGGCGKAFACAADEACEHSQCISQSGCSDGTREAFLPVSNWPNLAGCTAKWPRSSLRDAKTGNACGYELGVCKTPADACGLGWHVCASPPFGPAEISSQATAEECAVQPGAYVAAVGDQFCEPCSIDGAGAACCGERCVQQNGDCIYPGQTAWFGVVNGYVNVCGAIESNLVQHGVLCCRAP